MSSDRQQTSDDWDAMVKQKTAPEALTREQQAGEIERLDKDLGAERVRGNFYKSEIDRSDTLLNQFGIPNIAHECGDMLKPVDERIELVFVRMDTINQQLAAMTAERDVMSNSREALVEVVRELRQQLAEAQGTIVRKDEALEINRQAHGIVRDQLTQAEQQVARMREALQVLYDEQNDAPLENRRQQWQAAMTLASGALRETGAYQEVKKTT